MENIPTSWDHNIFSQLFAYSPKKAFEYRLMSTGTPIPDEWLDKPTEEVNDEISIDRIKELLTEAKIEFHHKTSEAKIRKMAIDNNLI